MKQTRLSGCLQGRYLCEPLKEHGLAQLLENVKKVLESRYSIERELGRGGMETVYLAEDLRHDRRVALTANIPMRASGSRPKQLAKVNKSSNAFDRVILMLPD